MWTFVRANLNSQPILAPLKSEMTRHQGLKSGSQWNTISGSVVGRGDGKSTDDTVNLVEQDKYNCVDDNEKAVEEDPIYVEKQAKYTSCRTTGVSVSEFSYPFYPLRDTSGLTKKDRELSDRKKPKDHPREEARKFGIACRTRSASRIEDRPTKGLKFPIKRRKTQAGSLSEKRLSLFHAGNRRSASRRRAESRTFLRTSTGEKNS
ncbi:hypothetical protein KM043_007571 [Ampulex compressa]|nr:hypothetical protein KM043_007571 [Ampulex compressa]